MAFLQYYQQHSAAKQKDQDKLTADRAIKVFGVENEHSSRKMSLEKANNNRGIFYDRYYIPNR
jgi:hypothetical protein